MSVECDGFNCIGLLLLTFRKYFSKGFANKMKQALYLFIFLRRFKEMLSFLAHVRFCN